MKSAANSTERAGRRAPIGAATRALICEDGQVRLNDRFALPEPVGGDAIVRPRKCGVSEIELAIAAGRVKFSGVLGHEFVGTVESIHGAGSSRLINARVVGSIDTVCGKCDMCIAGLRNHCRHRATLGQSRDGCLADRFTLPASNLVPVPDSVDDDHAVFAHAVAAAIQIARQLHIEGKPYVTILGDSAIGLLASQVLTRLNASVRIVGRFSENLALCEKWGVKHRHVDDVGRRADQDVVVDCTGSIEGLTLAMQLVRPRGKIVVKTAASPHARPLPGVDLTPIVENELEIIGSRAGPIGEAVSMLAGREIDVISLISKRMSLSDGPAILKAAAHPGVIKVLIDV